MVSMCGWTLSTKVLLISAGVVSLAVGLTFSVPVAVDGVPAIWSALLCWLKPPYLYLVINGIIITIAASSRFNKNQLEQPPGARSESLISVKTPPPENFEPFPAQMYISALEKEPLTAEVVVSEIGDAVVELRSMTVHRLEDDAETPENISISKYEDMEVFIDSTFKSTGTLSALESLPEETISWNIQPKLLFPAKEKPLITSRFAHRKTNRANPEGARALRVARAKKHETLESTWKMITEGRHVPLTRHLKKSDASEHGHVVPPADRAAARAPARIGREASLGKDELNRRVEAFIRKFNEEMRMQRQESMNQFMEMINRGL